MFRIFAYLHRHPDSGIFIFRLTVPLHLRDIIQRREIKKSTRTGLKSEAIVRSHQLYVGAQQLFEKAEKIRAGKGKRAVKMSDDTFSKITFEIGGKPVTVERKDPAEEAEIASRMLIALEGKQSKGKAPYAQQGETEGSTQLSKMVTAYFAEIRKAGTQTAKTIDENQAIFQLLQEILKNPAVSTIGIKSAIEFKNTLLQLPPNRTKGKFAGKSIAQIVKMQPTQTMTVASVNKYIRRVSALFEWARRNGYTSENPFSGIGLKKQAPAHTLRDRFTLEELKILLPPDGLPEHKRRSYQYWLPWLGLFTGARLEELCQLHLEDIRQEGEVWVFDVNAKEGRRLKTPNSARLVPVHPKLIGLGLLYRVEELRQRKEKRLFPELKLMRDGYGQTASKWFARHRKTLGINKPFHSLRHTALDEMKQKGADYKKVAAIAGHVDESMTFGRYGKPYSPEVLLPVISLLDFGL